MLDLEKCLILPVLKGKVLDKEKCSIGISAKSCAALNHVATLFGMAQNQSKQNNAKGIFLLLILLSHIKMEAETLKAVLLKMAFACMWYF